MTKNLHPDFIANMQEILGEEDWQNYLAELEKAAPVSIRYNPYKKDENQYPSDLEQVPWAKNAYYLPERPNFTADPLFHAGQYYVQEASSMFLEQAVRQHLDLDEAIMALDLCAAPGGKSTQLLSLLNAQSLLVSNEVIKSRAQILAENIQKWGTAKSWVTQNDPSEFKKLPKFFDLIVVDAPCSGEGMFRKAPHSIEEWSPKNRQLCALRQERILHDIWDSLRPGGILIYSTCTFNQDENEENLLKFRTQEDFDSLKVDFDEKWGLIETEVEGIYGYRFYPHRLKGEGFFLSVLQKPGNSDRKLPKIKKPILKKFKDQKEIEGWMKTPKQWTFKLWGEELIAIPKGQEKSAEAIVSNLRVVYPGLALAEQTRKGLKPLPATALWADLNLEHFSRLDLSHRAALEFLSLETLDDLADGQPEGWLLACYQGQPLGWLKKLKSRFNNYYPKHWKIRLSIDKLL
jgi:16S rRNA C967 or C1407 C5-methylase (RsmB/RsmF family)/NOL1/NOP2/fmu family ribosome biogenesis protein